MRIIHDLASIKRARKPVVVAAGFFDGVHLGHRRVIERAMARAQEIGGRAWALTFDRHPLRVLNPRAVPPLLTATGHKLRLLQRMGLHGCLLLPFNRKLAGTEPEVFVQWLLACSPPLTEIVVGRNWHFGRRGQGDPALLKRLSHGRGPKVTIARAKTWKGEAISSTRIRAAVLRGSIDEAASMLGRPFSVLGTVTRGERIGKALGYPTANLDSHNEVLPPAGVYAARVLVVEDAPRARRSAERLYNGVVNFGARPTFGGAKHRKPVFEVHILDFDGELYDRDVEVFFVGRLRGEKRFPNEATLRAQIGRDIEQARSLLSV